MTKKKLSKSVENKSLYGVCGGIAEFFDISPTLVRLVFIFTPGPIPLIVYIILANTLSESPEYL